MTQAQTDTLAATLPGVAQFPEAGALPVLDSALVPVWSSWGPASQLGPTATIEQGGGGLAAPTLTLRDHRAALYPARLAWLSENGYSAPEDREAMLYLWQQLDLEQIKLQSETIAEKLKEYKAQNA